MTDRRIIAHRMAWALKLEAKGSPREKAVGFVILRSEGSGREERELKAALAKLPEDFQLVGSRLTLDGLADLAGLA